MNFISRRILRYNLRVLGKNRTGKKRTGNKRTGKNAVGK